MVKVDKSWGLRVPLSLFHTLTTSAKRFYTRLNYFVVIVSDLHSNISHSVFNSVPVLLLSSLACARILRPTIMDSFFGWTATALAAYHLAGFYLSENYAPASGGTDASNRGGYVSSLVSPDG